MMEYATDDIAATNFEQIEAQLINSTDFLCQAQRRLEAPCSHFTIQLSFFGGSFITETSPPLSLVIDKPVVKNYWPVVVREEGEIAASV